MATVVATDTKPAATARSNTTGIGIQGMFDPTDPKSYSNPPHDPRTISNNAYYGSVKAGVMQQVAGSQPSGQKFLNRVQFLYNPAEIDVNYAINNNVTPPDQQSADSLAAQALYPGSTSVGFGLLFDRLYDVTYGPLNGGMDLRKFGVYIDIAAFEAMVGVWSGTIGTNGKPTPNGMQMVAVQVIFGGGASNVGLGFVGYITSASVRYTHFAYNMVPVRAELDITMTQLVGQSAADALPYSNTPTQPGASTTTLGSGASAPAKIQQKVPAL